MILEAGRPETWQPRRVGPGEGLMLHHNAAEKQKGEWACAKETGNKAGWFALEQPA